jgi:hypothetical protein
MDHQSILAAWRAGKLFVKNPNTGKVTQVPLSAKGGN